MFDELHGELKMIIGNLPRKLQNIMGNFSGIIGNLEELQWVVYNLGKLPRIIG